MCLKNYMSKNVSKKLNLSKLNVSKNYYKK